MFCQLFNQTSFTTYQSSVAQSMDSIKGGTQSALKGGSVSPAIHLVIPAVIIFSAALKSRPRIAHPSSTDPQFSFKQRIAPLVFTHLVSPSTILLPRGFWTLHPQRQHRMEEQYSLTQMTSAYRECSVGILLPDILLDPLIRLFVPSPADPEKKTMISSTMSLGQYRGNVISAFRIIGDH